MSNFYINEEEDFIVNIDQIAEITKVKDSQDSSDLYQIIYVGGSQTAIYYSESLIKPLIDFIKKDQKKKEMLLF